MEEKRGSTWKLAAAGVLFAVAGVLLVWPLEPDGGSDPQRAAESPAPAPEPPCPTLAPDLSAAGAAGETPPDDARSRASSLFDAADRLYEERALGRRNLYGALVRWREGVELLMPWKERTPEFFEVLSRMKRAEDEICEQYRAHRQSAELAFELGRHHEALLHVQVVLELVPEVSDLRYQWAKSTQLRVRASLREAQAQANPFGA